MDHICRETPSKGLQNEGGQNNCFLNVIIQALWSMKSFSHEFLARFGSDHKCPRWCQIEDIDCLVCTLLSLFNEFQESKKKVIASDDVRSALTSSYAFRRFLPGSMEDADETLDAILGLLHALELSNRTSPPKLKPSCRVSVREALEMSECIPPCVSHSIFGFKLQDLYECINCRKRFCEDDILEKSDDNACYTSSRLDNVDHGNERCQTTSFVYRLYLGEAIPTVRLLESKKSLLSGNDPRNKKSSNMAILSNEETHQTIKPVNFDLLPYQAYWENDIDNKRNNHKLSSTVANTSVATTRASSTLSTNEAMPLELSSVIRHTWAQESIAHHSQIANTAINTAANVIANPKLESEATKENGLSGAIGSVFRRGGFLSRSVKAWQELIKSGSDSATNNTFSSPSSGRPVVPSTLSHPYAVSSRLSSHIEPILPSQQQVTFPHTIFPKKVSHHPRYMPSQLRVSAKSLLVPLSSHPNELVTPLPTRHNKSDFPSPPPAPGRTPPSSTAQSSLSPGSNNNNNTNNGNRSFSSILGSVNSPRPPFVDGNGCEPILSPTFQSSCSGCGLTASTFRPLRVAISIPSVFAISFVPSHTNENNNSQKIDIARLLSIITPCLNLHGAFDVNPAVLLTQNQKKSSLVEFMGSGGGGGDMNNNLNAEHYLRGLVCFRDLHYFAFFNDTITAAWSIFDDANIREVGSWENVARYLLASNSRVCMVFYESEDGMARCKLLSNEDGSLKRGSSSFFHNSGGHGNEAALKTDSILGQHSANLLDDDNDDDIDFNTHNLNKSVHLPINWSDIKKSNQVFLNNLKQQFSNFDVWSIHEELEEMIMQDDELAVDNDTPDDIIPGFLPVFSNLRG